MTKTVLVSLTCHHFPTLLENASEAIFGYFLSKTIFNKLSESEFYFFKMYFFFTSANRLPFKIENQISWLRSLTSLQCSCSQVNSWGLFMMTSQATVIVRDSSNFPIIIFPLLSSYFPTITARMHESIVLSRIDCMADWLVQVHTLNAFVVITKTLTLSRQASKASNATQWKIQFYCHNFSVKIQSCFLCVKAQCVKKLEKCLAYPPPWGSIPIAGCIQLLAAWCKLWAAAAPRGSSLRVVTGPLTGCKADSWIPNIILKMFCK